MQGGAAPVPRSVQQLFHFM